MTSPGSALGHSSRRVGMQKILSLVSLNTRDGIKTIILKLMQLLQLKEIQ